MRAGLIVASVAGALVAAPPPNSSRAAQTGRDGVAAGALASLAEAGGQPRVSPELVDVRSGELTLRAQVWRPSGRGPFPAVLFNHGSYSTRDPLPRSAPETLGPVFARHGYVFLWLHRQGIGLSRRQGTADGDQFARAFKASFGVPPHRYHLERRILRAKELLIAPDGSVTAVALAVGFAETSSFSAAFRRLTGTTPSRYRRTWAHEKPRPLNGRG